MAPESEGSSICCVGNLAVSAKSDLGSVGGDADTVMEVGENDPNSGGILDDGDEGDSILDNEINM